MDDLSQDDALIQDFVIESSELLQHMDHDLVLLEKSTGDGEIIHGIFRAIHTIKGTSGFLGFEQIVRLTHRAEDVLNDIRKGESVVIPTTIDLLLKVVDHLRQMLEDVRLKRTQVYDITSVVAALEVLHANKPKGDAAPITDPGIAQPPTTTQTATEPAPAKPTTAAPEHAGTPPASSPQTSSSPTSDDSVGSMRVHVSKLDHLVNMVGELVLERNRLVQLSRDVASQKVPLADLEEQLARSTARLSFVTEELQTASLKTRMVPIDSVFQRLPRVVRDLSRQLGKQVDLQIKGGETEIDRAMGEHLTDPLIHLIRNSMDHGIEFPEKRTKSGKNPTGTIRLDARTEGDHIVVSIIDDGAGIDPDRISKKAIEKGITTPERLKTLSARDILDFIFLPGFSTVEAATDISGRGVGMDVVNSNLKKVNGTVELDSELGKGTSITLKLPLTMAIMPVLFVQVGKEAFGVPMRSVMETLGVSPDNIHVVEGRDILYLGARTLPLLRVGRLLATPQSKQKEESDSKVVIAAFGSRRLALLVDRLLGQEATVIKSLGSTLGRSPGVAGATICGDGTVRLLLDVAGLLSLAEKRAVVTEVVHA